MPRKISDIYTEYKIQPNLQLHMLRVAAVASVICDSLNENLDKEALVVACLLHDISNIVKMDLSKFPQFNEPEGLEYWQKVKDEFVEKYGTDDHVANSKVLRELGLPEERVRLAGSNTPALVCAHSRGDDLSIKILFYSDARVSPHGILSYDERQAESTKRYHNVKGALSPEDRTEMVACGKDIEREIFTKCKIKPEDITDETIAPILEELRHFVIK